MPRVSVLMPVYNCEAYVEQAIQSVLTQTFTDFELVVIDDGSTDASGRIVESLHDSRLRFVRNDRNVGLTPTLNRGLGLARGDLVARQDADDLSAPRRLERQVAFLDANPDITVVGTWYRKIDDAGRLLAERRLPETDAALRWAMLSYCPIVHSAATFRRSDIVALGGYDERFVYAQDFDLWGRVAARHRLATLPEYLVDYRMRSTSLTATIGDESGEGPAASLGNVRRLLETAGMEAPTPEAHAAFLTLMRGSPVTLGSPMLTGAFAHALELLAVFCARARISVDEATTLRGDVYARLRRRFAESIALFSAADFERVGELLYGKTRWLRLMRVGPVRSAIAAVARSPLTESIVRRLERS